MTKMERDETQLYSIEHIVCIVFGHLVSIEKKIFEQLNEQRQYEPKTKNSKRLK